MYRSCIVDIYIYNIEAIVGGKKTDTFFHMEPNKMFHCFYFVPAYPTSSTTGINMEKRTWCSLTRPWLPTGVEDTDWNNQNPGKMGIWFRKKNNKKHMDWTCMRKSIDCPGKWLAQGGFSIFLSWFQEGMTCFTIAKLGLAMTLQQQNGFIFYQPQKSVKPLLGFSDFLERQSWEICCSSNLTYGGQIGIGYPPGWNFAQLCHWDELELGALVVPIAGQPPNPNIS